MWPENGCRSVKTDQNRLKRKQRFAFIRCHLQLGITQVCLALDESPAELQEQQRSLGSSVGRAEVSRLSKITLSFPGCLLKIPWECLSGRIKVILIPYKKRTTPFTSKDERSVTDIDKE